MAAKQKKNSIRYKYVFKKDFNPLFVTGALGGFEQSGEMVVTFYQDRIAIPIEQEYGVENDNIELKTIKPEDHKDVRVRFVQTGITMNYPNLKEFHRWLGQHIKGFEESLINKESDEQND